MQPVIKCRLLLKYYLLFIFERGHRIYHFKYCYLLSQDSTVLCGCFSFLCVIGKGRAFWPHWFCFREKKCASTLHSQAAGPEPWGEDISLLVAKLSVVVLKAHTVI